MCKRGIRAENWTRFGFPLLETRLLGKIITRTKPLTSTNDCADWLPETTKGLRRPTWAAGATLGNCATGFHATHDVCTARDPQHRDLQWQSEMNKAGIGDRGSLLGLPVTS